MPSFSTASADPGLGLVNASSASGLGLVSAEGVPYSFAASAAQITKCYTQV